MIYFDKPFPIGWRYQAVAVAASGVSSHTDAVARSVQVQAVDYEKVTIRALSSSTTVTQITVRWIAAAVPA